jgi:hypothetical protein
MQIKEKLENSMNLMNQLNTVIAGKPARVQDCLAWLLTEDPA